MRHLVPSPWGITVVLAVTLLGCRATTFGADDNLALSSDPIRTLPGKQWSGRTVTLVSSGLAELREGEYSVMLGEREVPVTRVAPDSLRLHLPADLVSGTYKLTLTTDGVGVSAGEVEAVGWSTRQLFSAAICSDPTPWPLGRPRGVLVTSCVRGQPPLFISTEGITRTFEGLVGSGYSPSTSYRAKGVNDQSGRVARVDEVTGTWDSLAPGRPFLRHGYELGPGIWLVTDNHSGTLSNEGTGESTLLQLESEWLLVRSPAVPRATFVVSFAQDGLPILDTEHGTVVARVDGLFHTDAAAFSIDGTTLYASGRMQSCCAEPRLTRINTETGAILQIDSSRGGGYALAVDAETPEWLYELAATDSAYIIRIRNAADLSIVAEFTTPRPIGFSASYPGLVIDPARRHGYVFLEGYPANQVHRFDLLFPGD